MSKHNKVNPGQYQEAGRLKHDDMARERVRQDRKDAAGIDKKAPRVEGREQDPSRDQS